MVFLMKKMLKLPDILSIKKFATVVTTFLIQKLNYII